MSTVEPYLLNTVLYETKCSVCAEKLRKASLIYRTEPNTKNKEKWRGGATGKAFRLAISRSQVQILLEATLRNNLRQVVYTYVPLSPSSITWYRPKGGDALRLGR